MKRSACIAASEIAWENARYWPVWGGSTRGRAGSPGLAAGGSRAAACPASSPSPSSDLTSGPSSRGSTSARLPNCPPPLATSSTRLFLAARSLAASRAAQWGLSMPAAAARLVFTHAEPLASATSEPAPLLPSAILVFSVLILGFTHGWQCASSTSEPGLLLGRLARAAASPESTHAWCCTWATSEPVPAAPLLGLLRASALKLHGIANLASKLALARFASPILEAPRASDGAAAAAPGRAPGRGSRSGRGGSSPPRPARASGGPPGTRHRPST